MSLSPRLEMMLRQRAQITPAVNMSINLIICIGVSLLLSACGFSLRGNETLTSKFSVLQLQQQQPNSEFARLLKRSLEIASVTIADTTANSVDTRIPVLIVGAEQLVSRPVSVNPRARAAQYELRMSVDASLMQDAEAVMGPETLFVERSYFEDIENIAGNQEELEIITNEMRRELVNQLLRRLEAAPNRVGDSSGED